MAENKGISIGLALVITICSLLVTGVATYFSATYSMQNEINLVKQDLVTKTERIVNLEEEIKLYRKLPDKIAEVKKTTDETNIVVRTIRDAMLAAGIIKPRGG